MISAWICESPICVYGRILKSLSGGSGVWLGNGRENGMAQFGICLFILKSL